MGTKTQVEPEIGIGGCESTTSEDEEALDHLKVSANNGTHWFLAILEAISLWKCPQEELGGRRYNYVVGNEAFDWLLLAERLCTELDGLVPEDEKISLLFQGTPPIDLDKEEFQRFLGLAKYQAHLNFFYGVIVEESMINALEEKLFKDQVSRGLRCSAEVSRELAFFHLYGAGELELLREFRIEFLLADSNSITLDELREFTYWLFKYRLKHSDKAKVASDTKKGVIRLQDMWLNRLRALDRRRATAYYL
ncbi:MAG: hypothetical protein EXR50_07330 [Dehalococcoidia bacterium]|nr:hypothetical protein [Dehalococcoidia bacterium]